MKKILMAILMIVMLTGCSNKNDELTLMAPLKEFYCLYNIEGKIMNETLFKSYTEYDFGYVVTNTEDQVSLINPWGEEIIPFGEYKSLNVINELIYATKNVEATKPIGDNGFVYENLYILNTKGDVVYAASNETGIKISGLPIIYTDNTYSVLRKDGQAVEKSEKLVLHAEHYNNGNQVVICYDTESSFYDYSLDGEKPLYIKIQGAGIYNIKAVGPSVENGVVLYDNTQKNLVYINRQNAQQTTININLTNAYYDEFKNIILKDNDLVYLYHPGSQPILVNTYYLNTNNYLNRNAEVYGPHSIYKDGKEPVSLEKCQLYPAPKAIATSVFPVYVKDQGYKFYNFENKNVIATLYEDAEPFDINNRAIVKTKKGEGYSLIDNSGKVITSSKYSRIVYLGSIYYAIYNEAGTFGIIDKDGNSIVPVEFTDLPSQSMITHLGKNYLMLSKYGRSYVYSIGEEKNVIFSYEGDIKFNKKGYFIVDNIHYFNFDGEKIN